jgi:hypothetical protein
MNIEYAKDPRWANEAHTAIDLTVKWSGFSEEHPFTASSTDSEPHGRAVFEAAAAGEFGTVAECELPSEMTNDSTGNFPTPPSGKIPTVTF